MFFRVLIYAGSRGRFFGLGFQHLSRDPANVNARKNMFDMCEFLPNFWHYLVLLFHHPHARSGARQYIRPPASAVAQMAENCFE